MRTPNGIRTRATAVKGRRPGPLDDEGLGSLRRHAVGVPQHTPTTNAAANGLANRHRRASRCARHGTVGRQRRSGKRGPHAIVERRRGAAGRRASPRRLCRLHDGSRRRHDAGISSVAMPLVHRPGDPPPPAGDPVTPAPAGSRAELPRGGRRSFPATDWWAMPALRAPRRSVGSASAASTTGRKELEKVAEGYARGRTPQPVFELIATVANSAPGSDGKYRTRGQRRDDPAVPRRRSPRQGDLLLLGVQPGRADFLPEVRAYEKWLREPDVGLALDPEWAVGSSAGARPGLRLDHRRRAGRASPATSRPSSTANDLPEKVLVFHQLAPAVVRDESSLARPSRRRAGQVGRRHRQPTAEARRPGASSPRRCRRRCTPASSCSTSRTRRGKSTLMTPGQVLALSRRPSTCCTSSRPRA